eukprot:snap_masked-scaffold_11-processed-gene-12.33-mRNA-1 protein AED:1.00 eAED:1.00 QI:0/-1/0/0/-1/1/1/0/63
MWAKCIIQINKKFWKKFLTLFHSCWGEYMLVYMDIGTIQLSSDYKREMGHIPQISWSDAKEDA